MLYETAIAAEIFGVDRSDLSLRGHWYDLVAYTVDGSPSAWLPEIATRPYAALAETDTVVVSSTSDLGGKPNPELLAALLRAHEAGARIAALCTGAFILAAAGLLDQRTATTHWMHADSLRDRYPRINVRPDVLYAEDGQVLTSAGKSAALDLCLHLVHRDFGATAANGLARRLVVPAHRPGGQAQFIAAPRAPVSQDRLGAALEWARTHLHQQITVQQLADRAALSSRQLGRRMNAEMAITPRAWLQQQRATLARELLESTDSSIEQVAALCGMSTAATLRRHFRHVLGVSPTTYRATFRSGSGALDMESALDKVAG